MNWPQIIYSEEAMREVFGIIARSERTGEALLRLQRWLHRPVSGVAKAEIAELIRSHLSAPAVNRP